VSYGLDRTELSEIIWRITK